MPRPTGKNIVVYKSASTRNIISELEKAFPNAVRQTKPIAENFLGSDDLESCENTWAWVRENILYKEDGDEKQKIQDPSRLMLTGVGDCKSMTLLCASILYNLGFEVGFAYTSYPDNFGRPTYTPQHVYTIAHDTKGNEIIVDPVWYYFNSEKKTSLQKKLSKWKLCA